MGTLARGNRTRGQRSKRFWLTLSVEMHKLAVLKAIAPSSNGKTADSGSVYRGSNPCGAATGILDCGFWILDFTFWTARDWNPTVQNRKSKFQNALLALSSNGLGRGPLKAEIRVRFPLRLHGMHDPFSCKGTREGVFHFLGFSFCGEVLVLRVGGWVECPGSDGYQFASFVAVLYI